MSQVLVGWGGVRGLMTGGASQESKLAVEAVRAGEAAGWATIVR